MDASWSHALRNLTPNYIFLIKFGLTEVIIGVSKAKNCKESAGDVRIDVAAQKPIKNVENARNFAFKQFSTSKNEMSGIVRNTFS